MLYMCACKPNSITQRNALKPKCGTSQKDYRLRKFQRQILFSFELSVCLCVCGYMIVVCACACECAGISNSLKHTAECEKCKYAREFSSSKESNYSHCHYWGRIIFSPAISIFYRCASAIRWILFLHSLSPSSSPAPTCQM